MLLGPNCMGVVDTGSRLHAAPWIDLPAGDVAFVSQSGNLSIDFGDRARDLALGFSRFVSVGNQADVTVAEVLADCVSHEQTRAVAVYCEAFPDGRAFGRAALRAARGRQAGGAAGARPVGGRCSGRAVAHRRAGRRLGGGRRDVRRLRRGPGLDAAGDGRGGGGAAGAAGAARPPGRA